MSTRFFCTFVLIILCVPCFAEEKMPTVPELLKKMYDYRMAIDNMQAKVTVTKPIDTRQRHRQTETQHLFFAYDKGRVRFDKTLSNPKASQDWLYQDLSTQDFYFTRYPVDTPANSQEVNDGNNLFLFNPRKEPLDSFDPRRIGTDLNTLDIIPVTSFNYDTLLYWFYPSKAANFEVHVDEAGGEKLYKITYQFNDGEILNSYWLNPQKGYNLVRFESSTGEWSYIVTLGKFPSKKGDVWFPKETVFRHGDFLEERIVMDSVAFDVQDETPFTLAGLGIPVGYCVYDSNGERKYWDGKGLVDRINFDIDPVSVASRKTFWIVNGVGCAFIALWILIRWMQLLRRRSP